MAAWTRLDAIQSDLAIVQSRECDPVNHHCMSAWKRLDAIPSDLDIVQSGVPLACPLRCVPPDRIVSNRAVRSLVDKLSPPPAEQPARSGS